MGAMPGHAPTIPIILDTLVAIGRARRDEHARYGAL